MTVLLPAAAIASYHAHIYYEPATRRSAAADQDRPDRALRRAVLAAGATCWWGRIRMFMYQVAFEPALFDEIVPWLMLNRRGHSVLVHPNTGDDLADHRDYPLWLGERLALDFSVFD